MADFDTTSIASIQTTLAELYLKLTKSMTQKDRAVTYANIKELREALQFHQASQARTLGTRPRVATIDLQTGPASSSEAE
jgi:DNA-binding transcriptional regulator YiaG